MSTAPDMAVPPTDGVADDSEPSQSWAETVDLIRELSVAIRDSVTPLTRKEIPAEENKEQRQKALEDVLRCGRFVDAEVAHRMGPAPEPYRPSAAYLENLAANKALEEWWDERAKVITEVLSEIRPMGGSYDLAPSTSAVGVECVKRVSDWIPTEWVEASNSGERGHPLHVVKARRRAHYRSSRWITHTGGKKQVVGSDQLVIAPRRWKDDNPYNLHAGDPNSAEAWEECVGDTISVKDPGWGENTRTKRKILGVERDGDSFKLRVSGRKSRMFINETDERTLPEGTVMIPTGDLFPAGRFEYEAALRHVGIEGYPTVDWSSTDGYGSIYQNGDRILFASEDHVSSTGGESANVSEMTVSGADGTTVHELMHRAEHVNPKIQTLEREFLAPRLTNSETGELHEGVKFVGPKRERVAEGTIFAHEYMTRTYADGAHEVLSCGAQGIFSGRYGGLDGANRHQADPDHKAFTLGVFATI